MGRSIFGPGALAMAAIAAAMPAAAPAQAPGQRSAVIPTDCPRDCLIGLVRRYLTALKGHAPGSLPVTRDLMFTENNVAMSLGDGLWGTITGIAPTGLEVADAVTGQGAWFGVVEENGLPAYLGLRLHVSHGRIDEVETVVHRKTGLPAPFGDPDKVAHDPAFQEVLPAEQRRPRERLMAVADSYFNTVEQNDGMVFAPFDADCGRLENGISTTSNANAGGPGGGGNASAIAQGCEAQFKLGLYRINKRVRERRYPLIDEERGIVVATGFFDHANSFDNYKLTNGQTMRTALKWPNSITLLEAFRVKDGKIHRIEAIFTYVPYFMHNPWADRR